MIRICIVFVLLLIALMLGAMVFDDRGYVFVEFSGWVVEMNVFSLAISMIFIFVGFLILNWFIKNALKAASGSRNWLGNWGYRKKQKAFRQGLIALAETNYLEAKTQFSKVENEDFDGINLLAAADAEINLGQPQQAQAYWRMATTYEKSALAANISLIKFALEQNKNQEALDLIEALTQKQQEQTPVIKLWAKALSQAGHWQTLKTKLKAWKKALGPAYQDLMQQASKGSFAEIASKQGAAELKQNWQTLPRATRKDPAQQAAYIQQLIDQGMHSDAEQVLIESQRSGPNALLVPLFKQIRLPNPANSIRKLESWIKQDDLNVDLLSALAHIAFHSNDKVLAEKALNKAIKLANRKQDLQLMAEIKESQHDDSHALQFYKQSFSQQDK
ncbi:heme biosynthesis protein HemY [Paraglaciecola aquimarina]|uniref:Heme biosynthesis protein HemY n=1 Tax=Paraglaciecola algarum TaxID=3050085 RepID=A0ABS9DC05_9ALTE|nr:heme biosynthesis HemY N-terminal domain-containing protein [Paraglaciecola sp. G1-23]MCF2949166.1 heme biosynthesis protein HemY [Paraglaciecola sp. G1-23]